MAGSWGWFGGLGVWWGGGLCACEFINYYSVDLYSDPAVGILIYVEFVCLGSSSVFFNLLRSLGTHFSGFGCTMAFLSFLKV